MAIRKVVWISKDGQQWDTEEEADDCSKRLVVAETARKLAWESGMYDEDDEYDCRQVECLCDFIYKHIPTLAELYTYYKGD